MFYAGPNVLSQSKDLIAFSASSKTFVPAQKPILLNANNLFVWHKNFGPAPNILGPVKGQGISRLNRAQKCDVTSLGGVNIFKNVCKSFENIDPISKDQKLHNFQQLLKSKVQKSCQITELSC